VILVASGIDTFSKINYGEARKVLQNSGIPVYIVGTANLFKKKYGDSLPATDDLLGTPGRMTWLQADNTLNTFAKETGGAYFPVTFEGELPKVLSSINALLRSQYSLGFNPGESQDGKQHKLVVKVDVDGDGTYDDKEFVVQARQFLHLTEANRPRRSKAETSQERGGRKQEQPTRSLKKRAAIKNRCPLFLVPASCFPSATLHTLAGGNSSLKETISAFRFEKRRLSLSSSGRPRNVNFNPYAGLFSSAVSCGFNCCGTSITNRLLRNRRKPQAASRVHKL
jgi:hypothetical protein